MKKIIPYFFNAIYLPPYSPELNPIELLFNKFKIELKKNRIS